MGKAKSYTINGLNFNTQSALKEYIKDILHKYPLGVKIPSEDFQFLMGLLRMHPESETKIGIGVQYMTVQQDSRFGTTKHFQIYRVDKTTTDFSYNECIKPSTQLQKFKSAARSSVTPFIIQFRDNYFEENGDESICSLSNELVTRNRCHVDHIPPMTFEQIIKDYISMRSIDVGEVEFNGEKEDNSISVGFKDKTLEVDFVTYHNSVAKLRVVSAWGNLSISKKGLAVYQSE